MEAHKSNQCVAGKLPTELSIYDGRDRIGSVDGVARAALA
jgi:hypothetical protein